jgi:hypothetical protein
MNRAACTIVSFNYLPYARSLCQSFLRWHPNENFYVLMVDRLPAGVDLSGELFETVLVEDLGIPEFTSVAFKYDILELNTAVKPTFLKHLFAAVGLQQVIYFDPDICIYNPVHFIFERLLTSNIVLTPHITTPINDRFRPSEQEFLRSGIFNLGFVGVSALPEGLRFLDWWEERCLRSGYADIQNGLFVDQKWVNLVPCMFKDTCILKHQGCNMAYWNLHEREITRLAGDILVNETDPLIFFHFSGLSVTESRQVSKYTDRYTLDSRPDLVEIFSEYRKSVAENGIQNCSDYEYAFGYYSDGKPITKLARSAFSIYETNFRADNPFDSLGRFYEFAKKNRLFSSTDLSSKYRLVNVDWKDWRLRTINFVLRLLLKILRADRYTTLMRYLNFVTNIRNQKAVFGLECSRDNGSELSPVSEVVHSNISTTV